MTPVLPTNFRHREKSFTSKAIKSSITRLVLARVTLGKLPRHSTSNSLAKTAQLLVAVSSPSAAEISAMNFSHTKASGTR